MHRLIVTFSLALFSIAALTWGLTVGDAERLYQNGDLAGARQALSELVATGDGASQAAALKLLGQIEVDSKNWTAALEAWSHLAERHADSPEASSIDAALAPLEALSDCGCGSSASTTSRVVAAPPPASTPAPTAAASPAAPPQVSAPPIPAPAMPDSAAPAPTVESAPTPTPGSAAGLLLVGGWSKSFESSQEATKAMADFLAEAGVAVQFVPTDVAAARGQEVTLSFLLDQAQESGAVGVLFFSARFTHRDYVHAERYDPRGALLWKEKITGGTELRPSRERGNVRWALVERMQDKLSKRIGTPDLPTQ